MSNAADLTLEQLLEHALRQQRAAWLAGRRLPAANWLRQFPALAADPEQAAELIYHEFAVRDELGESPDWQEYVCQFPEYARALQLLRRAEEILEQTIRSPKPSLPQIEIDGYELLAEVGRGGMGVVYKARQKSLDRVVALKMIRMGQDAGEAERKRFHIEARAVARLQHPNIVQIYEIGEADGRPFLALEYIEGPSLALRLNGVPWHAQQAAGLTETLARAMHYAHGQQILHCDLKPGNILISDSRLQLADRPARTSRPEILDVQSAIKITDFGLAKRLDGVVHSHSKAMLGTPSYMAPEQAQERPGIDARTDVYGLGAVLYELLTGRPPFRADSALQTIQQVANLDPVPPRLLNPSAPRDLETVCLKCLEKEPSRRYATAEALADDLHRFRHGQPVLARPVGAFARGWRWCRRNPLPAGLVALLALTVTAGLASGFGLWWRAEMHSRKEAAARREAEENYLSCRELLGEYVSATRDSRIQSPEARHAQREALIKARDYCEGWRRRRPDDVGLRRDLAGVLTALAALDLHDGRLSEVQEAAEAARLLWQKLTEETPLDARCRDGLAVSLQTLGLVYDRLGRNGEAENALREAIALWDQLAVNGALTESALAHAASARVDLSLLANEQWRVQDMIRYCEERCDRLSRAVANGNTSTGLRLELLCDLRYLAGAYANVDRTTAVRWGQQGRAVGLALVEELPENAHAKLFLGECCRELAGAGAAAATPQETARLFEQAASLFERQRQRDPSDWANARLLAVAYWNLSDCHRQAGRSADALRMAREAVEVLTGLAERWPADAAPRLAVLLGQARRADLERQCGDPNAARLMARQVAADVERFCADSTLPVGALVVAVCGSLDPPLRHAGAPDQALRVAWCCQRLAEQLVRTHPDDPRHRAGLSEAWTQLGKTYWGQGRRAEAEAALRSAAATAGELAERWPEYQPLVRERRRRLEGFLEERAQTRHSSSRDREEAARAGPSLAR